MSTAGLDVSKAFNGIDHCGIFIKLVNVNVHLCILNALVN